MPKHLTALDAKQHPLIEAQIRLVERIAYGMARRLPVSVDRADLVQDGLLGLSEAILRWTHQTNGAHFENYMALRAHGAMLDGLRTLDHGSRKVRRDMRRIELAIQHLEHQHGRAPREQEVAELLDLPLREYQSILQEAHGYLLISLDDIGGDNAEAYLDQCIAENADPLVVLERSALRQALALAITRLPEQKQELLMLYYEKGLKMHEIGKTLRLTEARISQLHTQTIAQLRAVIVEGTMAALLKPRTKRREAALAT
jgi:RNA polymerase sigma factor for flagellar operon FliA